ncbi:MAG: rhodanese-like domain-containing protein [Litorimonas sp.]
MRLLTGPNLTIIASAVYFLTLSSAFARPYGPQLPALNTTAAQTTKNQPTKTELAKIKRLEKVHEKITQDHPNLRHVSRPGLQVWLNQNKPNIILLDIRPMPEYRISHIQNAVQIDPDSDERSLDKLDLKNKIVIVYCSVGRRSSAYATRLETELSQAGAQTVLNLEGGVFGWHNDGRKLVNANGQTDLIHPYNGFWGGRYLTRKNKAKYSLK